MRKLRSQEDIMATWKGQPEQPVVSICCITYNHESYIEDALEGFLIQETDFPFEILIHDDASTDKTADIIQEYECKYPEIIKPIYQTENQWSQGKRPGVLLYALAKANYIALCEGDDFWVDKKKLQKQVANFGKNESIIFHDSCVMDEKGNKSSNSYFSKKPVNGYTQYQMCKGSKMPTASVMIKKNSVFDIEIPPIVNGDHYRWAVAAHIGPAKFIDEVMSCHRVHQGGIWSMRDIDFRAIESAKSKYEIFYFVDKKFKASAYAAVVANYCKNINEFVEIKRYKRAFREFVKLLSSLSLIRHFDFSRKITYQEGISIIKSVLKIRVY